MQSKKMLLICVVAVGLMGCKANPAKPTQFFGSTSGMQPVKEIEAFHQVWEKRGVDWNKYKTIYVAPVNTEYLREKQDWQKMSFSEYNPKQVEEMALFIHQAFKTALSENKGKNPMPLVATPDKQTIILDMALTELVPTMTWLNAVSMSVIMYAPDRGCIAIECLLRDGETGEVLGKIADRECGKDSILNFKDFSLNAHGRAIVKEWADQAVAVINADDGSVVKDSAGFELKPW